MQRCHATEFSTSSAASAATRGLWIAGIIGLSMAAYFGALWLSGLRPHHFRRA